MWSPTLPFWQALSYWAMVVALITGGVAAGASFASSYASGQAADIIQAESDVRISVANQKSAEAAERGAALEKEAAVARVEQGRLAVRLEQATAEVLRLRKGVARHVEPEQFQKIQVLLTAPGQHIRLLAESNPEAIVFRDKLVDAFLRAGLVVDEVGENSVPGNVGIEVYGGPNTSASEHIARALLAVFGPPVSFTPNIGEITTVRVAVKPATL